MKLANSDFYCIQEACEMAEVLEESLEPRRLVVSALFKDVLVNVVLEFNEYGELIQFSVEER